MLTLSRAVWEALRGHGEEAYPAECCGALLGQPVEDGWRVRAMLRARNASAGRERKRYEIAPEELVALAGEARRRGLEIAGFYHSHPDHPPTWSATDLAEAHWPGCCYVITEVAQGRAVETRAYLLAGTVEEDKRFAPEELRVEA
ncbi:MAG TPA: M67 family metallopeptidase [Terracidiphilus sp.]|nr:M67 family metallopeptidase [Terracidiphilus sp.]